MYMYSMYTEVERWSSTELTVVHIYFHINYFYLTMPHTPSSEGAHHTSVSFIVL